MKAFLKLLLPIALSISLLLTTPAAAAADTPDSRSADILYTLGLVEGTSKGYELHRAPTRAEALVLAVRLSGMEDSLTEETYTHPFTDVPAWADRYAAYAYASGLISGTSATQYSFDAAADARDVTTLLLRVLGYSDASGDFSWEKSEEFAGRMGLSLSRTTLLFTRANLFELIIDALNTPLKDQSGTLLERLIREGDVDGAKANALGFPLNRELTGTEIYEKCSAAVFHMSFYENDTKRLLNEPCANASGFFITPDGVAVSNYHAFEGATVAIVTLPNGEQYRVTEMLSFDRETDLVVFRVGRRTLYDETSTSAFPCLEYLGSEHVRNGETVFAIGNPLSLQGSITSGIVSHNSRPVEGFAEPMIQNTAPISQGSSGGVLVNAYGQAIGSTCAYFIAGHDLYLAIPLDILFTLDYSAPGCTIPEMHEIIGPADTEVAP